jgi:hypothetical protein
MEGAKDVGNLPLHYINLANPDHEIYRYKLRPLGTVFYSHIKVL